MNLGKDWLQEGLAHVWLPYTAMGAPLAPVPVVATQGTRLKLADGRDLVDGLSSWWTACHGYNHPRIQAALESQLADMPHVMFGGIVHPQALMLATRLAKMLPGELNHVFFSDSGSVAVEVALKMAAQYWINRGEKGRNRFVSFRHGYHGDTLGCMAVSDHEGGLHAALKGYIPDEIQFALPELRQQQIEFDKYLGRERDNIAAVILEPLVQGAGGMKFHAPETLSEIARICRRHDILFIADEVMTGFGRAGHMFACQAANVTPDIICLSKALTGGTIGMGATVATEKVFSAFKSPDPAKALMHGPSFMANPMACAAANASLDLFEKEPRLGQIGAIERHMKAALAPCADIPGVKNVRVRGAIGVVQLEKMRDLDWLRRRFPEIGVFLRPFADIVYLMPAFVITDADLSRLTGAVEQVLKEWAKRA